MNVICLMNTYCYTITIYHICIAITPSIYGYAQQHMLESSLIVQIIIPPNETLL